MEYHGHKLSCMQIKCNLKSKSIRVLGGNHKVIKFSLHFNMGSGIYRLNSKSGCTMHMPVMVSEVLKAFEASPEGWLIDGTFGLGGHTSALLERYPHRKVFGIDLDADSLAMSKERFQKFNNRTLVVNGNYADMTILARESNIDPVGGILLDLGLSSMQLETLGRGFSFRNDEMLDMRYLKEINWLIFFQILGKKKQQNASQRLCVKIGPF